MGFMEIEISYSHWVEFFVFELAATFVEYRLARRVKTEDIVDDRINTQIRIIQDEVSAKYSCSTYKKSLASDIQPYTRVWISL